MTHRNRHAFFAPFSSHRFLRTVFFALINTFLLASACLADALPWNPGAQGQFITSLCRDTTGHTWIGTEDNGVWRCDPSAPKDKQYTHFTTKDGLGDDNAYALVCDKAGRIWAGTLNHGVSVFNGKQWRTYGPVDGPLGSRVFALAVNPKDGGVWGATEAGLFRYQNSHWTCFTRADGLPSDGANALAFDQGGTLYVGTQCDGVAIGSPADNYKSWRVVPGPQHLSNAATGSGLPSGLINCLLVVRDSTVYAGTPTGLASSRDQGRTWHFRRGADWKDKLAGLAHPLTPSFRLVAGNLLREDYVTCLAEDGDRSLWVGHRQSGVELYYRDPRHQLIPDTTDTIKSDFAAALLPDGAALWVGRYGGGLSLLYGDAAPVFLPHRKTATPLLPVPAAPPTLAELSAMLKTVTAAAPDKNTDAPEVIALDDDWVTEGDWLGRYGRYWACLNAICSPTNYEWGAGWMNVADYTQIGPNHVSGDTLRYFVTSLYTANPRTLEMPPTYLDSRIKKGLTTPDKNRREAEIDDHGEDYPPAVDGPDIYTTLGVPEGVFILSLYDFNKDAHGEAENRDRDYRISIRAQTAKAFDDLTHFPSQPELEHGRIRDFWGGVYKRFLVRGPVDVTVRLDRNNSRNTILPGMMLDLADELPPPYFHSVSDWQMGQRMPAAWPPPMAADPAGSLLTALEEVRQVNPSWWATHSRRGYLELLRWYDSRPASERNTAYWRHLGTCCYEAGLSARWEDCLRRAGLTPARDIEHALKWDGSYDLRGQGNRIATEYLDKHPAINKQTRKTAVALSVTK